MDNFSYNLALLHGQTDLLNKAKQDANIIMRQVNLNHFIFEYVLINLSIDSWISWNNTSTCTIWSLENASHSGVSLYKKMLYIFFFVWFFLPMPTYGCVFIFFYYNKIIFFIDKIKVYINSHLGQSTRIGYFNF